MNAFEAGEEHGKTDSRRAEQDWLFKAQNKSDDAGPTVVPVKFLKVEILMISAGQIKTAEALAPAAQFQRTSHPLESLID